jgi:hypothetical protein
MPRRLNSVNQGGHYVEAIDVVESELEAVVSMLGITDAQEPETARRQIHARLEDLKTDRARTVMVKTVPEDLQDLEQLAKATDPGWVTERLHFALESLQKSNPVLHRRLKWAAPQHRLRDQMTALRDADEAIIPICREISDRISALKDEICSEDGRGRRADEGARAFASRLYVIWVEFTARGTSRQNALYRKKDPFGDFVDAAGKLIEPGFKGRHLARKIHEAHRQQPSGEK